MYTPFLITRYLRTPLPPNLDINTFARLSPEISYIYLPIAAYALRLQLIMSINSITTFAIVGVGNDNPSNKKSSIQPKPNLSGILGFMGRRE